VSVDGALSSTEAITITSFVSHEEIGSCVCSVRSFPDFGRKASERKLSSGSNRMSLVFSCS